MSKISVGELVAKKLDKKGEGRCFSIKKRLSHTAENLHRDSFTVGLISGTEKFWIRGESI